MKLPLYLLALPYAEDEARRCCDDRRAIARASRTPAWPLRWPRKVAAAVPASLRVFRRELARPVAPPIDAGTPVLSSSGRSLGVVRSVVVDVASGGSAYAVAPTDGPRARVLLLPREEVRGRNDIAVIDERVVRRLERKTA
jgi:hypothetical protein